jgi:hypothetical protein
MDHLKGVRVPTNDTIEKIIEANRIILRCDTLGNADYFLARTVISICDELLEYRKAADDAEFEATSG